MRLLFIVPLLCLFLSSEARAQNNYEVLVLGICQDGGFPQYNCSKECCLPVWKNEVRRKYVASLAVIDKTSRRVWLIDCTPDIKEQMHLLYTYFNNETFDLSGIFLTHAHVGHYAGLINLGREVSDSKSIPVHVMPRMRQFLENNGPWKQLVDIENIQLNNLTDGYSVEVAEDLSITPFLVPHRDEYSETVGYSICSNDKTLIYIPDIDKWSKWDKDIKELVSSSTYSLLDGTFYNSSELSNRNMAEIPHPSVEETMLYFKKESTELKRKIYFTHFNHSNPLQREGAEYKEVIKENFNIAFQEMVFVLTDREIKLNKNGLFKR